MKTEPNPHLWRVAWDACKRSWRELLPWVLGFSALLTICNFYIMRDEVGMMQNLLASFKTQPNLTDLPGLLTDYVEPPVVKAANICSNIITFIGFFYFTAVYLKEEPIHANALRPEISLTSFGGWLMQILKAALCVLALGIAVAGCGFALGLITHLVMDAATNAVAAFASVAAILALLCAGLKFCLVSPLALSDDKAAVKNSWEMTKGQLWRLLWNYLCIGWSVVLVFLAAFLVLTVLMFFITSPESVLFIGGLSALMALFTTTNLAITCVYFCVVCRVLMEENEAKKSLATH
jgi:hypothetical protein